MKMVIFALLVLVAVLVLLLLRKYTRLEFVGHASLLQKTWSVKLGAIGALIGMWAQSFPDAALRAWAVLPPDIKNLLPPNIVALISPALVVLAVLSQYVRQPALKDKADKLKDPQQ
ncbi:hypothetical protein ACNPIB_09260 [Klebsiella pneumoniae]|uniref:DUF7940 domain-containing protein n=1 Tax=Klebsiella pneumoniae complex TaxID=3390273 RepID=UPI0007CD2B6E|nr:MULTISPECIES: hypothetical protein [Klebsiella]HCB0261754.1 hypothetical protein [Klebsiella quasipneumoniae subsp. similipneumoniae]UZF52978.1 hypothetical protein LH783_11740 [Klebsiella quasipneumoniae]SBH91610.1 Uncharacterised protein [Klebsiella pneumoniae]SWZ60346.1 Uncharacterised protein [Klebsiella pneumoniae]VGB90647.1 Uncharacterised protein [Klebsiella quasipneumoniae]